MFGKRKFHVVYIAKIFVDTSTRMIGKKQKERLVLEEKLFMSRKNIPIILSIEKTHPLTHCSDVQTSSQTKWHKEHNSAKLHIA